MIGFIKIQSFVRQSGNSETMFGKSLKEHSKNLSGLSLEAFIMDATSQGQNYPFHELLEHQNIRTVKTRFIQILKLFNKGNFSDYKEFRNEFQELCEKQLFSLKKLTILSQFRGLTMTSLATLQKKLNSGVEEVIEILLKMSIDGTISIKIDEQEGTILIFHAELRMMPIESSHLSAMSARLQQIIRKNDGTVREIERIKDNIDVAEKVEEKERIKGPDFLNF